MLKGWQFATCELCFFIYLFISFYWVVPGEIEENYANFVMLKNWLFAICATSITSIIHLVCPPAPHPPPLLHKVFHNLCFYFYWVVHFSQEKFGGEGANKMYYEVQIANKSEVSELELSLSIRCWWYSNLWLNCQTFFAFRRFSHISSYLPQIEIIKTIFELQDFLNSPVKWKILSTVKPVFNRTRKLAPSSDRAIIFAINN